MAVLGIWAAATAPMGVLAWVVAPTVAGPHATAARFAITLTAALTAGLVWQFVLVMLLVVREQRSLRWRVLNEALWLRPPVDRAGRRRRRLLWWTVPAAVAFAALQFVPWGTHGPTDHDFGAFLKSTGGHDLLRGNWAVLALTVATFLFTSVLGEELLFRGLLLPRMRGAFGRADWIVNAVLMGLYHVHQPWSMPSSTVAGALFAYPTKRFSSAWMGIIIHSAQSVFLCAMVLTLVIA